MVEIFTFESQGCQLGSRESLTIIAELEVLTYPYVDVPTWNEGYAVYAAMYVM